jgi:hypothetical protein
MFRNIRKFLETRLSLKLERIVKNDGNNLETTIALLQAISPIKKKSE